MPVIKDPESEAPISGTCGFPPDAQKAISLQHCPASLQAYPSILSSEWTFHPFIQALYSSPNSLLSNLLEMVCSFGSYSGSLTKNSLLEAAIPFRTFSMSIPASVPAILIYVCIYSFFPISSEAPLAGSMPHLFPQAYNVPLPP